MNKDLILMIQELNEELHKMSVEDLRRFRASWGQVMKHKNASEPIKKLCMDIVDRVIAEKVKSER